MCLNVPLRVVAMDEEIALVADGDRQLYVNRMAVPALAVGDYVAVSGGLAVRRVAADVAQLLSETKTHGRAWTAPAHHPEGSRS